MARAILTQEQYEELTDILEAAERNESRLTPWEINFIADTQARFELWDRRTRVSFAQWRILLRIQAKL